jgi:uncharacterized protein (TIGR03437 family)
VPKQVLVISFGLMTAILPQVGRSQTPAITPTGVVSAATFINSQPLSAGGLVSIFGTNLASQLALADTIPLATSLANVTVTFNGIAAPLEFVTSGQINAQIPYEIFPAGTNGTANVIVSNNGVPSAPEPITINQFAPGVFTIPPGGGYSIAIIATDPNDHARYGALAAPVGAISGYPTTPARPGDALIVYATGLGPVTPSVQSGHDSLDTLRYTVTKPTVLIGNLASDLFFWGLTPQFPGVYQLNLSVPQATPGDKVPLQVQIGGITSPATGLGAALIALSAQ